MSDTNWLILIVIAFLALIYLISRGRWVRQQGGFVYVSDWYGPSYGIGYDGIYPSYDSTYVDGNSRGWYNAGGWYGQTMNPYYY